MIIGIDLGTTNCVAAVHTEEGPRLVRNALGEYLTPSVVGIDEDGGLLIGRAAKELQVRHPDRCASLFKRQMGNDWSVTLDGNDFNPEKLSSLMLSALKADAEADLGRTVTAAVVTVPAYFNELQRKATMRAGKMAGLKVERILNEPTAAAIAYGLHEGNDSKVIIVFDLGGGTFDVSVVELFDGTLEVRSSSGEVFLGGEDFTTALAARVLQSRGVFLEHAEMNHPQMVSRMRQEAEVAKHRLTREEEVSVRVPDEKGDFPENPDRVTVTRAEFAEWTQKILARTEMCIRRALGDANLKRKDVDEIILVGGATRMPAIADHIARLFSKEPRCSLNPDEVVAIGAAIQAGLINEDASLEDLVVTDVAPFTLGIASSRQIGGRLQDDHFSPIINRNTVIPVSRVDSFSTMHPNQTMIRVRIYQGESRKIDGNLFLGEFEVTGIPRGPAGQEVEVRFTYDLNGVLEVEATVVATKKKFSHIVTRHAKGMSENQIADAVRQMESLKTHPREETMNRYVLRRADRVYTELPLVLREELDSLIEVFEAALEEGDPKLMESHRDALTMFLDRFDQGEAESDDEQYEEEW